MISQLDLLRSKLLKETLRVSFFRDLFLSRANRVLFLALAALVFYFSVSLFFPLWVLLIGPILWGVPHIISSLRLSTYTNFEISDKKKFIFFQSAVWLCVFAYRIASDIYGAHVYLSAYPLLFESLCMLLSFSFQTYLLKKVTLKSLFFTLVFSALLVSTYYYSIQTALVLLIGHNYIPLYSWFKSCQDKKDLNVFFITSFLYILLSILIFTGACDLLYTHFSPQGSIAFLKWDYSDIVSGFGASDSDYQFWFHIVSLYAFSQAMHYFLWIKAIPENYQPQQHPPSFRWSLQKLSNDFGSSSLYLLLTLVLLGAAYWLFFEFQMARLVYFSISAYHGFMEISALPFIKSNRKKSE